VLDADRVKFIGQSIRTCPSKHYTDVLFTSVEVEGCRFALGDIVGM
jgi:hypothetical protein